MLISVKVNTTVLKYTPFFETEIFLEKDKGKNMEHHW